MQVTLTVTVEGLSDLLGAWMHHARHSLRSLAEEVSAMLPGEMTVSHEKMRRYLSDGLTQEVPDPLVVAAITKALGHSIEELPVEEQERIAQARALVSDGPTAQRSRSKATGGPTPIRGTQRPAKTSNAKGRSGHARIIP